MKKSDPLWISTDRLWSKCVCTRDGHRCRFCGKPSNDAHHVVPRNFTGTAFVVENGLCACRDASCHNHDDVDLNDRCIELIGKDQYDWLWILARGITRLRKADLEDIAEKLRKELRYLKEIEKESRI